MLTEREKREAIATRGMLDELEWALSHAVVRNKEACRYPGRVRVNYKKLLDTAGRLREREVRMLRLLRALWHYDAPDEYKLMWRTLREEIDAELGGCNG